MGKNLMDHTDERTNWNWVCKDQAQSNFPFLAKINKDSDGARPTSHEENPPNLTYNNELWLPTVNCAKDNIKILSKHSSAHKSNESQYQNENIKENKKGNGISHSSNYEIKGIMSNCDDCFIASTEQYKNLYIQIATCYIQRINQDHNYVELLNENSLVRQILIIASQKMAEIEKHGDNRAPCKEMVKAIGELASRFIDLALKYKRTNGLLELFNEALNLFFRSNQTKVSSPHHNPAKCILEHCEPVSNDSEESTTKLQNNGSRKVCHLTDWYGDDQLPVRSNSEKGWIWSETSEIN